MFLKACRKLKLLRQESKNSGNGEIMSLRGFMKSVNMGHKYTKIAIAQYAEQEENMTVL